MNTEDVELHIPINLKDGYFKILERVQYCKDDCLKVRKFVWHNRKENFIIVKPYKYN